MTDGSGVTTALCSELGKMYAEEFKGSCPSNLQEPFGKTLDISFNGIPPYVIYNPLGGSDFLVTKILAKKFHFIPKFIYDKSVHVLDDNTSMVYQVKNIMN